MSLPVGDAALHAAGGDRPSDRRGSGAQRAREAAARAMGFASYAAYHLQRWHHEGWRISDMAEECGLSQSAIREGGRKLLGITTVPSPPPGKPAVPATRASATRSTEDRRLGLSGSLSRPLRQ
jgi:hypothetical protein